jgi:hypothetical protein
VRFSPSDACERVDELGIFGVQCTLCTFIWTFTTYPLVPIHHQKKIAPKIAVQITSVNEPLNMPSTYAVHHACIWQQNSPLSFYLVILAILSVKIFFKQSIWCRGKRMRYRATAWGHSLGSLSFTLADFAGTANGKTDISWHNFRSLSACPIFFHMTQN